MVATEAMWECGGLSVQSIESEVRRFLGSREPEVLCIKGRWGVGKTYAWKRYLRDAKDADAIASASYSYVSLFGLNSLEDLRFSVFESTVTNERIGSTPDAATFAQLVNKGSDWGRRLRPLLEVVGAALNRKGVADVLFKSAFLAVRNQIVCLDDLERAGAGLAARDVLGLASFLKEERGCKVVLLLNDREIGDKQDFDRQLEKVADVALLFDPTPTEAAGIALEGTTFATTVMRSRVVELGIANIRVMKRIERLALRLETVLSGLDDVVVDKAVTTLVLAGWSVQQPGDAPPLSFLRSYNRISLSMRTGREQVDPVLLEHEAKIRNYPFTGPDALDLLLMDAAEAGFLRPGEIRAAAEEHQREWRRQSTKSAYSRVWEEQFHGSLATDDADFLDALHETAFREAGTISLTNINSGILVLREFGRVEQADELVVRYVEAHAGAGYDFFDLGQHYFPRDDHLDETLREAFAIELQGFADDRDPLDVLLSMAERQAWGDADVALLAKQTPDWFEQTFEALRDRDLRRAIEIALAIGNGSTESSRTVRDVAGTALRRIASKSPLRARRLARYGVVADGSETP